MIVGVWGSVTPHIQVERVALCGDPIHEQSIIRMIWQYLLYVARG